MWTKTKGYRSFYMLVRIQAGHGFIIPIPIPLVLLDQTFEVIEDLVWLAEKLVLRWVFPTNVKFSGIGPSQPWTIWAGTPTQALKLCREMINELRRYGKWRMVEVEARDPKHHGKVRVYVDFI